MATPARTIRTRRIAFAYPDGSMRRHYADGDLIMSHVLSLLSALFPEGEDFFVESVRNYREQITDPELKRQVAAFIGQEAMHSREHRTLNTRLQDLGYQTWLADRLTRHGLNLGRRVLPKVHQLAVTAALEHYTATLAEMIMTIPAVREGLDDGEIRSLFLWHALEESEHKSVAFDVFQTVSGDERIRTQVMNATTLGFIGAIVLGTTMSLLVDPATYNPRILMRSVRNLRRSPFLTKQTRDRIRDYNRRDFHPDDWDAGAVREFWRTELFGDDGSLTERLRAPAVA